MYRVLRGGSWNNNPNNTRAANRNSNNPDNWNNNVGARCAKAPQSVRADGQSLWVYGPWECARWSLSACSCAGGRNPFGQIEKLPGPDW